MTGMTIPYDAHERKLALVEQRLEEFKRDVSKMSHDLALMADRLNGISRLLSHASEDA